MVTFRDLLNGLRKLGLDRSQTIIAHASLSAFGQVQGGASTLLGTILEVCDALIVPTFTYKTMVTPEVGPPDNGMQYGTRRQANLMAEVFHPNLPSDHLMGAVAETLRLHRMARRSLHPILSFAGINARAAIDAQTYTEPLAPIRVLTEAQGDVLLLGVDHTVNTSIHYAERLAGRKQFVRWALTPNGVRECPGFPGCSEGFQALAPRLERVTRKVEIGPALVQVIPLSALIEEARTWILADPMALLCNRRYCERCNAVRALLQGSEMDE